MAEFPALPLWTDAWVADTHHMSIFARGLYMDLLVLMWRTPGCRVPNDASWLMARLRISESDFDNHLKPIIDDLCQRNAAWLMQKRLTREFEYVRAHSKKMSELSKRRWEKEKDLCLGNAPTPTPTPTPLKEDKRVRATRWHPDSKITPDWLDHALLARRRNMLPDIDLKLEAERFENFWSSKSGAGATKLDWHKTWINWILKAEGPRNGNRQGKQSAHDRFAAAGLSLIHDAERAVRGGEAGPCDDSPGGAGRPLLPP